MQGKHIVGPTAVESLTRTADSPRRGQLMDYPNRDSSSLRKEDYGVVDPASDLPHRYLRRRQACRDLWNRSVTRISEQASLNHIINDEIADSTIKSDMAAKIPAALHPAALAIRRGCRKGPSAHTQR